MVVSSDDNGFHEFGGKPLLVALVAALPLSLAACGDDDAAATDDRPQVAASFYPLAFVTERVGGDAVQVENLTSPGVEPHDLELTPQQVGAVADADLVVFESGFQPAVDDAVEQNAADRALDVAEVVELLPLGDEHAEEEHADEEHAEEEHDHGELDPHVWLDPTRLATITDAVADRLAELAPDDADAIQSRAADLTADLTALDNEFRTGLASCEIDTFVTSHAAFGYLAARYGLHMEGISGLDPDAEPSAAQIADVHDVVAETGVNTIFYERLVSPKVAETIASDLDLQTAVLDPIEGLTDDTEDEDYFSLMRANLDALRKANVCS